jgi:selenocysteine-specific elongation factor
MGMPREELKSRLKMPTRLFNALLRRLVTQAKIVERGAYIHLSGHEIRYTVEQQKQVNELQALFMASPNTPPTIKECRLQVGEEVYNTLVESGELVPVSTEVVFRKPDYEHFQNKIIHVLREKGTITVAETRDIFDTSRRYVLALLEYMDVIGVTVRDGDVRRLRLPAKPNSH